MCVILKNRKSCSQKVVNEKKLTALKQQLLLEFVRWYPSLAHWYAAKNVNKKIW